MKNLTTAQSAIIGIQENGSSPEHIKRMAWRAIKFAVGDAKIGNALDIGGGRGDWSVQLAGRANRVSLLDYSPPPLTDLPTEVVPVHADLNQYWPVSDQSVDFAFGLEVIEHLENPRHFFREIARVLKVGGHAFVSTPNNHSWGSKLTFVLRGQHRKFQEPSYPAHIMPLLLCDLERICSETGLILQKIFWSNVDTLPRLHWQIPFGGKLFSDTLGALVQRIETRSVARN